MRLRKPGGAASEVFEAAVNRFGGAVAGTVPRRSFPSPTIDTTGHDHPATSPSTVDPHQ